jgi:hypothetical protein
MSGSLTPLHRSEETVSEATTEGVLNGLLTLIPTAATVGLLVRNNPFFAQRTNWQSRTALAIMPALFVAALSSEHKLSHRMREIATETQHGTATVHWAEQQMNNERSMQSSSSTTSKANETPSFAETQRLAALYQQSLESSGVCILPGNLQWYHHVANYTAQYPFRVLAAVAVPSVGYIFYGRTEQAHLQLSQKIMHTRVIGQFATISLLLAVMGFKEYMDKNGRFISQEQADDRVAGMHIVRSNFLLKLEEEKKIAAELKAALSEAHEQDRLDSRSHRSTNQRLHKLVASTEPVPTK